MGFFKSTASDELFRRTFTMAVFALVRERPNAPDFSESNLRARVSSLLKVSNAKPASSHLVGLKAASSLLMLQTQSAEVAAIADRAAAAEARKDLAAFSGAIAECEEWLSRRGIVFGEPPTMNDLLDKLRSRG